MFKNPSLITRIAIGKLVGFVFGLFGFISLPYFWPEAGMMFRWGILFWYTTLGAIIGVLGVVTWHPLLHLPMPWWFRAPLLGAWMNFMLTLFVYDEMAAIMLYTFGENGLMASPFWFVAEGAIVGVIIGCLATKYGGEGKDAVDERHPGEQILGG
jgi:hypothetical protein